MTTEFQTVCRIDEVPEGQGHMFSVGDVVLAIFNLDGKLYALDNRCPHAGASLVHGLIDDNTVTCRIHHWRFRISDGANLDDTGNCSAKVFPLRVVGDNVQVAV